MFSHPPLPPGGPVARFGSPRSFDAFGFCDGSLKRHVGACGSLLLDTNGALVAESSRTLQGLFMDSNQVEFQGLLDTLSAAALLNIKSLWIGVDCFELVFHMLKNSLRYTKDLTLLAELISRFEHVCIQAIARKHNKQADALARKGIINIR